MRTAIPGRWAAIVSLGATALAALCASALRAEATPVSAAVRRKLGKAFAAYVREPGEEQRTRIWERVSAAARKLTIAEIEELVAASVPGDTWKGGFSDGIEYESGGETWTYSAILPKKRPKGLVPLVLDIGHASWKDNAPREREVGMRTWLGAAGCEDDVVYVRTRVLDALSSDGRYAAWTAPPRRPMGPENLDAIASLVMDAVRDACLRYPIDPDRVYVQGISQTGYWTWWLAQFAPDRWAAAAPVGAVTFHVRRLVPNVLNVPLYVLHGTADPTCPFAQAQGMAADVEKAGGIIDFRPTEGGGHMKGVFSRFGEIWPEMAQRRRDPNPAKFERRIVSGARPDAYWLRALGIAAAEFNPWGAPCRIAGEIDGQTLRVSAEGCDEIAVLISPRMLDVGRTVTIELNGKVVWRKKPQPDAPAALELARLRGDGVTFGATVVLSVPEAD